MRWYGHETRIGSGEMRTEVWWGNPLERGHLEDLGLDGTIILKCILKKLDGYGLN
jgi:hypothetical protein